MKKIAAADVKDFKLPPYHFNMASAMLQSEGRDGAEEFLGGAVALPTRGRNGVLRH